ncbi:DUF305 domain-containing protein [Sphaerisporangium album]|uniref:DUF305 domain-containing protein n=1 Tax=Sphaerisporangium album TaxID=509200 RepID=A0A367FNG2_9ACTN|nr:DUF305 domain-containing protein [Sphaerisporangium album]RCG31801.1 DUF305 domain-containing protein [Sphaerisporangium album]
MRAAIAGVPVLVVLCVLPIASCAPGSDAGGPLAVAAEAPSRTTGPLADGRPGDGTRTANATDVAWLQLAISMTGQALRLLGSVRDRTSDPALIRAAARMSEAHRAQLGRLRELLRATGVPESDEHEGHDIPGVVTADDLAVLGRAQGPAFDRLFARHIGEYLRQSVLVAAGERTSGADPEIKIFAAALSRARTADLAQLPS